MPGFLATSLGSLYHLGLKIDRKITSQRRLAAKVVSVGNISVGGRSKTPWVILISRFLKSQGLSPVVLTRGYGRAVHDAVTLDVNLLKDRDLLNSPLWADDPTELAFLAECPVLIGEHRFDNARRHLAQLNDHAKAKIVFVLDDGFQHWSLARDFDLVLTTHADLSDGLLPLGRLREPLSALSRADLSLERDTDFHSTSLFPKAAWSAFRSKTPILLTTRAQAENYHVETRKWVKEQGWGDPLSLALADHSDRAHILSALTSLAEKNKLGTDSAFVVVGGKESVKMLSTVGELRKLFHDKIFLGSNLNPWPLALVDHQLALVSDKAQSATEFLLSKVQFK